MRGRKDGFPGADGSTIEQTTDINPNAATITIYGSDGETELSEDKGFQIISITEPYVLQGNTSQVYATQKPLVLIYSLYNPGDWYTDNDLYQNNTLWTPTIKSFYDPCPKGWQVPQDGTWNDYSIGSTHYYSLGTIPESEFRDETNGRLHIVSWYPAAGYYRSMTGTLVNVGWGGYAWSSSINSFQATSLTFSNIGITPANVFGRAAGFSVRCIQE